MTLTVSMWSAFVIVFVGTFSFRAASDLYNWWRNK